MFPQENPVTGKQVEIEVATPMADFESRTNLVGLFDLLLQIDKRNHPEFYKSNDSKTKAP
jgi:hypothetical protein